MPVMNIIEAVRSALQTQMRLDQRVVVLGAARIGAAHLGKARGQAIHGRGGGEDLRVRRRHQPQHETVRRAGARPTPVVVARWSIAASSGWRVPSWIAGGGRVS